MPARDQVVVDRCFLVLALHAGRQLVHNRRLKIRVQPKTAVLEGTPNVLLGRRSS